MNLNSDNPQVSVIIPTYNRAHLIKRAIQSVLYQTYQNFEIIVVDDGSTDNTEEIVKNFNNRKIKYIRYNENKRAATAKNIGIKASRAEFIAFQDSDDEWLPTKLERQMEVFKNAPLEVGVVYTGVWLIKNNKRIYLPLFTGNKKEGNIYKEFFGGIILRIRLQSVVVRKECFERAGIFEERLSRLEDFELLLRIARYYEFKYINQPLVIQHYTPFSVSSPDFIAYIKARKLILEKHFGEIRKDKKLLVKYFFATGSRLCLIEEAERGRRNFLKPLKIFLLSIMSFLAIIILSFGSNLFGKAAKLYQKLKIR